jgi:hypothetical protein
MFYIFKDLIIHGADQTEWDVTRFLEHAKLTKVNEAGEEAKADQKLNASYIQPNFGELSEPATILDREGKVMVWALPGVLHPNRVVRQS